MVIFIVQSISMFEVLIDRQKLTHVFLLRLYQLVDLASSAIQHLSLLSSRFPQLLQLAIFVVELDLQDADSFAEQPDFASLFSVQGL